MENCGDGASPRASTSLLRDAALDVPPWLRHLAWSVKTLIITFALFPFMTMAAATPPESSDSWITDEGIPVASLEEFPAAADRVVAALGGEVELLGFGEALHGGEEILRMRNRLFEQLVGKHGYTAIAIESSFPRARLVNEYIHGRGPADYKDLLDTGFGNGMGQLEANRPRGMDARLQPRSGPHDQAQLLRL